MTDDLMGRMAIDRLRELDEKQALSLSEMEEVRSALPDLLDAYEERDRLRRVLFGPSFVTGDEFNKEVAALEQISARADQDNG
jgi:hypothetical protein